MNIQNEINELEKRLADRTEKQKTAKGQALGALCIEITFIVARLEALRDFQNNLLTPIGVIATVSPL